MATGKTFFSYSRTDSAFVLKLAKDLRDAGVGLWLDQLDIKGGSHWDSAIEKALNSAASLIVVLSDDSVKSNNVMDEVSFALESGKTVIPVLLEECVVPFRLRRLQRIDFTGDYRAALNQLLEVLKQTTDYDNSDPHANNQNKPTASSNAVTETNATTNPVAQETHYVKRPETSQYDTGNVKAKELPYKKYLLIGGLTLVIGIAVWLLASKGSDGQKNGTAADTDSVENAQGAKSDEQAGAGIPDDLKIGDEFEGGYVFYIDSLREHALIAEAGDFDVQSRSKDGDAFCKELNEEIANYKAGGYTDWRLPTEEELRWLYESREKIFIDRGETDWYASAPDANCQVLGINIKTGAETTDHIAKEFYFQVVRSF